MGGRTLGVGVLALAVVLPWTTRWQFHAPSPDEAMLTTPLFVLAVATLLFVAGLVARTDPWLGAFVAYSALACLWTPAASALDTATWIATGALLLWLVRAELPAGAHALTVRWLVAGAVLQALYGLHQIAGYDVLWEGLSPLTRNLARPVMLGTLGNPNLVAAAIALVAPLAWWPLAVAFALLLGLTGSYLGFLAVLVGLTVRCWAITPLRWSLAACAVAGAAWKVYLLHDFALLSTLTRFRIWRLALTDALTHAPVLGYGPGSWWARVPWLQRRDGISGQEWFTWAHNDLVQLAFEGGLVALALVAGWLWAHRAIWTTPYAPALAALSVLTFGVFPWHLPVLALPAIVLVGLASPVRPRAFEINLRTREAVYA